MQCVEGIALGTALGLALGLELGIAIVLKLGTALRIALGLKHGTEGGLALGTGGTHVSEFCSMYTFLFMRKTAESATAIVMTLLPVRVFYHW